MISVNSYNLGNLYDVMFKENGNTITVLRNWPKHLFIKTAVNERILYTTLQKMLSTC